MLVRKQIELTRAAMLRELGTPVLGSRRGLLQRVQAAWQVPHGLVTLSVRSAFDLYLGHQGFTAGGEIVMTGANIPDMAAIVRQHGLRLRAVDFDLADLAPSAEQVAAAVGPRTRAIVFAQLFGSRVDLGPVAAVARAHRVPLIEDAAQAFDPDYRGHPQADLAMFSFGPIKSATALGGALTTVADGELAAALRARLRSWPVASGWSFRRRLARYLVLTSLARPWPLARLARHRDLDELLSGAVRSFAGKDLTTAIRQRPARPLLRLLARRLEHLPVDWFVRRRQLGAQLHRRLRGQVGLPDRPDAVHGHWVLPVLCDQPEELQAHLRGAGFDATRCATLAPLTGDLPRLRRSFDRLLYLPFSPDHTAADRERLVDLVRRHARLAPPERSAVG